MSRSTLGRKALAFIAFSALSACAPNLPQSTTASDKAVFPEAYYRQARARGEQILQVDAGQSLLVLEVRRAGALARFGHDHVVASHDVKGYIAPEAGRADLMIRLDELVVDEADLRRQAGFDTQPSADDIAGTRHNMLSKVLQSDHYPSALVHIERKGDRPDLQVAITLHGQTRTYLVPATIERTKQGMLVSGSMQFNQSDFGITPYAVLNGALSVQDRLDLRFRIVGTE